MNKEKVILVCRRLFDKEIRNAKKNYKEFNYKKYERELYYTAIRSFKIGFFEQLESKLDALCEGDKE